MRRPQNPFRRLESSSHKEQISSLWFPLILVIYCGVFYACYAGFNSLPTPNLSVNPSSSEFNSRNARNYLTTLTKYGPKVAGSVYNEKDAVEFLLDEVEKIYLARHPNHELDVDLQIASGAGLNSLYQGVQNVIVRLKNSGGVEDPPTCLLINSHFDTVAVSPGGGDATTMISVMLETLRILATQEETFEHCHIFLFNGCEEMGLQGSHAFITQHKWRSSAKAVINLDSAGNGGREILFQASEGHSWLMNYYRRHAPHPFSSAMGEELFQADTIPSDTDFRIFRDYGGIPGMDFAHSTNGYVYHTKLDTPEIVPDGTLQHTGDNVLALAKALANAEELKDTDAHVDDSAVFFDFMNFFMVYYTKYEAIIVNTVIMVFCVGLQIISYALDATRREGGGRTCRNFSVGIFMIVQLISLVVGCGVAFAMGYFYKAINQQMAWYHNSFLIFPMYMCPMFFFMALGPAVLQRFTKMSLTPWDSVEHGLNLNSWLLICLLIVTTVLGVRSGFMILVPVFIFVISLILQIALKFLRVGAGLKLIFHYIVQMVPFGFYATWTVIAFATFMPFAGRNGVNSDSEMLISAFAIGMGLLMAIFLIPTIPMFKSPIAVSMTFVGLWLVGLILISTPVGFPYAENTTPQRMTTYHIHRTFYNLEGEIQRESSLFFVRGNDPNKDLTADYLDFDQRLDGGSECANYWLCGLPLLSSTGFTNSYLFDAPKPTIPGVESNLRLTSITLLSETTWRYSFSLTCPNHCVIYLSPVQGTRFGNWSLFQHLIDAGQWYPNPNLYSTTNYNLFLENRPELDFTLEVTLPTGYSGQVLNAGVLSHYTANRNNYSEEYTELLEKFPSWTTTTDWISTYKSYEF